MTGPVYRSAKRKGFTVILRSAAQDKRLSLRARGLFLLMQSLPENWEFTQKGLAKVADATLYEIRKALAELENAGYLSVSQTHDEGGKFAGTVYELSEESAAPEESDALTESPEEANQTPEQAAQSDQESPEKRSMEGADSSPLCEKPQAVLPQAVFRTQQNNKDTKYDPNKTPLTPQGAEGAPDLFGRFWNAYPRKQKKADALKAWKTLNPSMDLCRIMSDALKVQKRSEQWQRDGGRYIPLPGSWLRGRRWEDDPGPAVTPDNPTPTNHEEAFFVWY